MLSFKTRYAMLALIKLAKEYGNGPILIHVIAKSEKIPQRYLENILLEIKKTGMIGSKLGKDGGYFLKRPPEKIDLATIVRHFEGSLAMIYCVSEKAYQSCEFCKNEKKCKLRSVFMDIRNYTSKKLQGTKLSDLM
jgi:Rrf2 family protein